MPEEVRKDTFEDHLVALSCYYGKRRSWYQKTRAEMYLSGQLRSMGYEVKTENIKYKLLKNRLIIAGNLDQCEKVYITAFDTPRRSLIPNYKYYPFDDTRNRKNENIDTLLSGLILTAMFGTVMGIYYYFLKKISWPLIPVMMLVSMIYSIIMTNRNNFNKSSASMALLLSIAENSRKTAFVYVDNNSENNVGLKALFDRYGEILNRKELLYLDCLASGKELVLAFGDKCQKITPLKDVYTKKLRHTEN